MPMGLFKKKADPITDRARALNAEISALEARIKKLNQQVQADPAALALHRLSFRDACAGQPSRRDGTEFRAGLAN